MVFRRQRIQLGKFDAAMEASRHMCAVVQRSDAGTLQHMVCSTDSEPNTLIWYELFQNHGAAAARYGNPLVVEEIKELFSDLQDGGMVSSREWGMSAASHGVFPAHAPIVEWD